MSQVPNPVSRIPTPIQVLRACLAIRGFGLGANYLWHPWEHESDIFGMLLFEWNYPESVAQRCEDASLWMIVLSSIAVGIVGLARPKLQPYCTSIWRMAEAALLIYCLAWEITLAAAMTYRGGAYLSQLTFGSHALRIATPAALLIYNRSFELQPTLCNLLRLASSLTFFAHGVKAYLLSPIFTTMVIGSAERLSMTMPQAGAESILRLIGVVDLLLAIAIVITRWRYVALYMAVWGLITAVARTTGEGWMAYPETLVRSVHVGGPLAIYLIFRGRSVRRTP